MNRALLTTILLIPAFVYGCGPQPTPIYTRYTSDSFGFTFSIPEDLSRAGWGVVDAEDATVRHEFVPPDSSSWEAVAVVVPPGFLFPALAPVFVDVINVKDPTISPNALADLKVDRLGDRVLSRKTNTSNALTFSQIVHGSANSINYETYTTGNGLGFAFLAQGASDTSATASAFIVDSDAYDRIIATFRLTDR